MFSSRKRNTSQSRLGQSLVELLIAVGLFSVMLPALLTGMVASRNSKAQVSQRLLATTWLQESKEAVRSVREKGWATFAVNGTYHPVVTGSSWSLVAASETANGLTRQLVISDVQRNSGGTIVASGGTVDPATKQVTYTVSWTTPTAGSIQASEYVTRYLSNAERVQTTQTEFNTGVKTGTVVTNVNGGEVTLAGGGLADWCRPQDSLINTVTLPKIGNSVAAKEGGAYVGSGDGTAGVTFINVAITNPQAPATPSASVAGTFSSSYVTNSVFSDGSYAYLATNSPSSEVVILNLGTNPYTQVGTIDLPGNGNANGVYVTGNIAYVTSANKLYSVNVTTKTGTHSTPLASVSMWLGLGSTPVARQIIVVNGYAFVGTGNTLFGLQRFKIGSGATSFDLVGVSNLNWEQQAQGLAVSPTGNRAYVAFNSGAGVFPKGFFIVDTSEADPPWWWPLPTFYNVLGTYNAGTTDPRGMALGTGNKAIVVGLGGTQQYQVVDISNENNPQLCGGLTVTNGVTGIAAVQEADGDVFSYIITGEAQNQFKIIAGGPGGTQYVTSGSFESSAIDATASANFNRLSATVVQPAQSTLQLQVAVAAPVSGSCTGAAYSYVGPGGSASTFFTPVGASISATIPTGTFGGYQNPQRCFRYKGFFNSTDYTQTPVLYDATVNYSP